MADRSRVVIVGAGEFAEEIAELVTAAGDRDVLAFVDVVDRANCSRKRLGLPVIWIDDLDQIDRRHAVVSALGSPQRRAEVARRVAELGFSFATVVHPRACVSPSARLGPGTLVNAGAVVAASASLGQNVFVNRGALLGHHSSVGDFTTVGPGTNVAGRATIGAGAYLGMGSIVLDGLRVGRAAVVGAGAVVVRDVPDDVQVVGVPARIVRDLSAPGGDS